MSFYVNSNVVRVQRPPNADSNIIKIAVINDESPAMVRHYELDPERPLADIVREMCSFWQIERPCDYTLQIEHKNAVSKSYVTEAVGATDCLIFIGLFAADL